MASQRAGHSSASVIKSAEMMVEPKTHPIIGSPVTQPVGVAVGSEEVGDGSEEVGETVGSSDVGSPVGSLVGSDVGSSLVGSADDLGTVMVSKDVAVVVVPSAVT